MSEQLPEGGPAASPPPPDSPTPGFPASEAPAPEAPAPDSPEPAASGDEDGWLRLSPRKLLIDPLTMLRNLVVPLLAGGIGIAANKPWLLLVIAPVVLLGLGAAGALPYLTTHYRVTERQLQVRRGWINRSRSTVNLERVRSVDLNAQLTHRLMGLRVVSIGTGVDDEKITLDALDRADAEALRQGLLARRSVTPPAASTATSAELPGVDAPVVDGAGEFGRVAPAPSTPPAPPQTLAVLDPRWVRFAPFNLARLVLIAAVVGGASQFFNDLPVLSQDDVDAAWRWVTGFAVVLVLLVLLAVLLVGWVLVSVTGYVTQWWNYRLTRADGSLRMEHGLFTTRSVSVEEKRVRGVRLDETVLMRWVRGADLSTLSTGMDSGTTQIVPPCPAPVARDLAGVVLGDDAPVTVPMTPHGWRAARRLVIDGASYSVGVGALVALLWGPFPGPVGRFFDEQVPLEIGIGLTVAVLVLGVLLAWPRYRHLGHARTAGHLVAGSGVLTRRRSVLEDDGVIGWVVTETFFQRRAGLCDLVATTAAGDEKVRLPEVPKQAALALMAASTPDALSPFWASGSPAEVLG